MAVEFMHHPFSCVGKREFSVQGRLERVTIEEIMKRDVQKGYRFEPPPDTSALVKNWFEDVYAEHVLIGEEPIKVYVDYTDNSSWRVSEHAASLLKMQVEPHSISSLSRLHLSIEFHQFLQARAQWYRSIKAKDWNGMMGAYIRIRRRSFFVLVAYNCKQKQEWYSFTPYDFDDIVTVPSGKTPIFFGRKKTLNESSC